MAGLSQPHIKAERALYVILTLWQAPVENAANIQTNWLNARWRAANRQTNNSTFEAWCAKMQAVPKDYPTLTTEQWLEACAYFGGCALCNDESIDSRVYFVPFTYGGRYCNWNVIPLCMSCATHYKQDMNPFIRLEKPAERQAVQKIIQYLEVRLNAASSTEET